MPRPFWHCGIQCTPVNEKTEVTKQWPCRWDDFRQTGTNNEVPQPSNVLWVSAAWESVWNLAVSAEIQLIGTNAARPPALRGQRKQKWWKQTAHINWRSLGRLGRGGSLVCVRKEETPKPQSCFFIRAKPPLRYVTADSEPHGVQRTLT